MGARPSSFRAAVEQMGTACRVVPPSRRIWSEQQGHILDWFARGSGHLVVRARAGTGKTSTIVAGLDRAPESEILACAFNKGIERELANQIQNVNVRVRTLHAFGYQTLRDWSDECRIVDLPRGVPSRAETLTRRVVGSRTPLQIIKMISTLHTKAREILLPKPALEDLEELMYQFDLEPDEGWGQYNGTFVSKAAHQVLHGDLTPEKKSGIDFADMIHLPLAWELIKPAFGLVAVDEAQDLTLAQLAMAEQACQEGGRICVVGDDRQAIYGFRGADTKSLDRLKARLGAIELPLTITYRCGTKIVARAQRLVPDIQVAPYAHEGVVETRVYGETLASLEPGHCVLSRLNAPLASMTLALLRRGTPARMVGRDIGRGILARIYRIVGTRGGPPTLEQFLYRLETWRVKTTTKHAAVGRLDLVDQVNDQAATIEALCEGVETMHALTARCHSLFEDESSSAQVTLSSIHKAKGLEWDVVYLLQETLYRRRVTKEEQNIEYVAITRAKQRLVVVVGVPSFAEQRRN